MSYKTYKSYISYIALIAIIASFFHAPLPAQAAFLTKAPNNLSLVGYWPLDDNLGGHASDLSGNGNTGTISGATWTDGKRGKALSFDGSSFVSASDANLPSGANAYTVCAWLKPTTINGVYHLAVYWGTYSSNSMVDFGIANSNRWFISQHGGAVSGNTAVANVWTHVCATQNGSNVFRLYENGTESATGTMTSNIILGGSLFIGKESDTGGAKFIGSIDDVRVYSRALSATDVSNLYRSGQITRKAVSESGLVAYWPMNEGRGGHTSDSSNSGNTGTLTDGPSWTNGKKGKALSFNGSTNYVDAGNSTSLDMTTNVTLSAWIKRNSATNYGHPVVRPASDSTWNTPYVSYGFEYSALTDDLIFILGYSDNNYNYTTASTTGNGAWFHAVGTYDGVNRKIYINGVLQQSVAETRTLKSTTAKLYMGLENTLKAYPFNGSVDDVRIFNRALSAAEIAALYKQNETVANANTNSRITNGLVGLWSFNGYDLNMASTTGEILDRSGNNNSGDNIGGRADAGRIGQGWSFDGVDDYINVPRTSALDLLSTDFSFSAWIKINGGAGTYRVILSKNNGTNVPSYELGISNGNKLYFYQNGIGVKSSDSAPTTDVWHHVAFTFNNSAKTGVLYIDGAVDGTATGLVDTVTTSLPLYLGVDGPSGLNEMSFFNGPLDEVRVYNRALTADEVKQLYLMGK